MTTKSKFKLHVALIQHSDNTSAQDATFRAWLEGPEGLDKRLNPQKQQPDLPLEEEKQTAEKPSSKKSA